MKKLTNKQLNEELKEFSEFVYKRFDFEGFNKQCKELWVHIYINYLLFITLVIYMIVKGL